MASLRPLRPRPIRTLLPALLTVVLIAAGCAGDDEAAVDADAMTTTSTTDTTVAAGSYQGYVDHVSELYAGTENWICHPDAPDDACDDLDTTVIEADGSQRVEPFEPAADPTFDCFYVYPTTSQDQTGNSDLDVDESEINTVRAQVARYESVCRVFAPAYRQVTVAALGGGVEGVDRDMAYGDVLDAWKTYVNEHNDGRGVVLVGHSQGAGVLQALIAQEIDPNPELVDLLVSAVLMGTSIPEPGGEAEGFENIPPCASAEDVGCLISFSSYRAGEPPVEGAIFARSGDGRAVCVDPVALGGGDGIADAVFPTTSSLLGGVDAFGDVGTPFVSLPDAFAVRCEETDTHHYLSVGVADPEDQRPLADLLDERLGPTWGLHLLDANVPQEDLIQVVGTQGEAYQG